MPVASLPSDPGAGVGWPSPAGQQWIFTPHELLYSPSLRAGMSPAMELGHRGLAVRRLMALKDLISTPQLVPSTAAVYVHRFYMCRTMQAYDYAILAAAAFFLASKVEEHPRRLREIVGVTMDLNENRLPKPSSTNGRLNYDENGEGFVEMKRKILFFEGLLLTSLGFDLAVAHPHYGALRACDRISWEDEKHCERVKRVAWTLITDSCTTMACILYPPSVIAAAGIVCACAQLEIPLPPDSLTPELFAGAGNKPGESAPHPKSFATQVEAAVETLVTGYARSKDDFVFIESQQHLSESARTVLDPTSSNPSAIAAPTLESAAGTIELSDVGALTIRNGAAL